MEERLQKLLAQAGFGSRRACEEFVEQGRVSVNGRVAQLGDKADPVRDEIVFDGQRLPRREKLTYVLLNKPQGVLSSLESQGGFPTVRDLVSVPGRLYPVGRLDLNSEGLILLTNDGELTEHLSHPRHETEKEYRVLVRGTPDQKQLETWRRGVMLPDERRDGALRRTAPAQVTREKETEAGTWLRIIMHEGRKHEIRDTGSALGLPVLRLTRIRLGPLVLGNLKPGEWRVLTPPEVGKLRAWAARGPLPDDPAVPKPNRPTAKTAKPAGATPAPVEKRGPVKRSPAPKATSRSAKPTAAPSGPKRPMSKKPQK